MFVESGWRWKYENEPFPCRTNDAVKAYARASAETEKFGEEKVFEHRLQRGTRDSARKWFFTAYSKVEAVMARPPYYQTRARCVTVSSGVKTNCDGRLGLGIVKA